MLTEAARLPNGITELGAMVQRGVAVPGAISRYREGGNQTRSPGGAHGLDTETARGAEQR
jgi:hypothetical protein